MSVQVSYKKQFTLGVFFILIILAAIEGIVRTYEFFFYHVGLRYQMLMKA